MEAVTKASVFLLLSSAVSIFGYRIDYINPTTSPRLPRHSFQQPNIVNNPYTTNNLPNRNPTLPAVNRPSRSEKTNLKKPLHLDQQSYAPTEQKNVYYLNNPNYLYGEKIIKPLENDYYAAPSFKFEMPSQDFDALGTDEFKTDMADLDKYNFHEHGHKETHGEIHYHEHKHLHQHDHKQQHKHEHKQDHKHEHDHKHSHDNKHDHKHHHGHKEDHKHEHKHGHDHKHGHKHGHKHDHHHDHKHSQDHKHQHHHGHKHDNHHKHDHHHGHKHDHHNQHKHDHHHHNEHKHKHEHGHKHGHKHHHEAHHGH